MFLVRKVSVSYRQQRVKSLFFIQSDKVCFVIWMFKLFALDIINNMDSQSSLSINCYLFSICFISYFVPFFLFTCHILNSVHFSVFCFIFSIIVLLVMPLFQFIFFRGSPMVYNRQLEHSTVYLRIVLYHITCNFKTWQQHTFIPPIPSFVLSLSYFLLLHIIDPAIHCYYFGVK